MNLSYTELFLKILTILNYKDKENFVDRFEKMNHLEAMTNCIERLPQVVKKEIISSEVTPDLIQKYVHKDEYMREITDVSTKALSDFLQHVTPALTDFQKEKIAAVFPIV